jgi:hypothetical protein
MSRRNYSSAKAGISKRIVDFFQKTFFQKHLNNWFGYLFLLGVALVFGYLLSRHVIIGFGVFGVVLGLFVAVLCLSNAEIGFYTLVVYSFFAAFLNSFFFRGQMPVGIIFDGLVLVTFLGLIIKRKDFRQRLGQFTKIPLVIFILLTLSYNAIQVFNPNSMASGTDFLAFRKFLGYVIILFTAYTIFDNYQKIRKFIILLFVVSLISALYGCIQEWHGLFSWDLEQIMADPHAMGLLFVGGEFRKFSTMSDPSSFGILMSVCAVFFLILALHEKNKRTRAIFIVGALFMVLGMSFSGTRTAYATVVGAVGFFVCLNFEKKSTRVFGAFAAVMLLVLLFGPGGSNQTIQRFRSTFSGTKDESYKVRVLSRAFIQPYIRSHPIGGGLGTTGFSGALEHPGHYLANFQPDSSYVKRAAETGWVGLGIVCVLYFLTLKVGIRQYFRAQGEQVKALAAACVTCMFAFYIAEFAQVAIGGISDVVVYYPMLAMMLKLKNYDENGQPKHTV